MKIIRVTWKEVDLLIDRIASQVDFKPDLLVGVSRGGLVPVRLLGDRLETSNIAIIKTEFYTSIGKTERVPVITQDINVNVKGKRLLVVDDVADTGQSLIVIKNHLKKKGARVVKFATIHYKIKSNLKPDFYAKKTSSWIVYPWEKVEAEKELKETFNVL